MSNPPNNQTPQPDSPSAESELQAILGDIDQIIVKQIFQKLTTGNKKKDDATWLVTCNAARVARNYLSDSVQSALDKAVREARMDELEKWRNSGIEFDEVADEMLDERLCALRTGRGE